MLESNSQYLRALKKKIRNAEIRQEIILMDTLIGSYNSRKEMPDFFKKDRQIVGQIYESEYIATQRRNTLDLLEKINQEEVYERRIDEIGEIIRNEEIDTNGIYDYSKRFIGNEKLRKIAGKRIEIRLLNSKERKKITIKEDMSEGERKKIFNIERNKISYGLIKEIDDINLQKFK